MLYIYKLVAGGGELGSWEKAVQTSENSPHLVRSGTLTKHYREGNPWKICTKGETQGEEARSILLN